MAPCACQVHTLTEKLEARDASDTALRIDAKEANDQCKRLRGKMNLLKDELSCCICMDAVLDTRLPCGHLLCGICAEGLPEKKCPLCKAAFQTTRVARRGWRVFLGGDAVAQLVKMQD